MFAIVIGFLGFIAVIVLALRTTKRTNSASLGSTSSGGAGPLLGRGIILSASRFAQETSFGGVRYERRDMVMDVELPGEEPYQVSLTATVPRICEAVPGASLDVQVNPLNRNSVTIIGPAGASDWLPATPGWSGTLTPQSSAAKGNGCIVVFAIVLVIFVWIVTSLSSK